MKKLLLLAGVVWATGCWAQSHSPQPDKAEADFKAFLVRWEEAQSRFVNGDATMWKQNSSQSEEASILGAFGGFEKGWKDVGPRYDWAASQHKKSGTRKQVEYRSTVVSGDLAFTVAIERDEALVGDQIKAASRALRVTQIFRREQGAWKLLHRHADPLVEKKAPSAP